MKTNPASPEERAELRKWSRPRHALGIALLLWAIWMTYMAFGGPGRNAAKPPFDPDSFAGRLLLPSGYYRNTEVFSGTHFTAFSETYRALVAGGSWNWMVGRETWGALAAGLIGLAIMTVIGRFFVSCFEIYVPRGAALPLWFVFGVGLCGLINTFLALAGLLYQWLALLVLILTISAVVARARRAHRRFNAQVLPESSDRRTVFRVQKRKAIESERESWLRPKGFIENPLAVLMLIPLFLITALTFFHAVFFPETYWDALILYLGYARGIFLEHGFPVKVVGQVGVGLGANYPHLFELTGATIATWFNRWSPLYLQLATPVAGLLTILLVYHTALRMTRSVLIALAAALLVRSAPYLITYHTWCSNYSFAVLFGAVFFYLALRYIEDGLRGYFQLATLCVAFAMHINYLMGALWICWAAMILLAHWPRRLAPGPQPGKYLGAVQIVQEASVPDYCRVGHWPRLSATLASGTFWKTFGWGVAISSVWHVRNWIVTGNPVYAFFTRIFPATKHVNPEVMASAAAEWQANGDGIGIVGGGLWDRLLFTWPYFVNNFSTCYKWAPAFMGIVVPGIAVFAGYVAWQAKAPRFEDDLGKPARTLDDLSRLGLLALLYVAILFVYHYALAPFYMYHLLGCFAVFGVFCCFALRSCPRAIVWFFCAWAVFCGFMPGLPWAMMGRLQETRRLIALHNPGMPAKQFYRIKFGDSVRMWDKVNELCKNTALLTHENRALLFDPSIQLVHLDDWEVQEVWGKASAARLERLRELGVRYYLYVPMEEKHPVNARLGVAEWIADGALEKVYEAGGDVLYRFRFSGEGQARQILN